jgi:hypothetical protein
MALKNYGEDWRSKSSKLWTYGRRDPPSWSVNFRHQIGVYVLKRRAKIVYVGRAKRTIFGRVAGHLREHEEGLWTTFSWFGPKPVDEQGELAEPAEISYEQLILDMETLLIYLLTPSLNKMAGAHRHIEAYEQLE